MPKVSVIVPIYNVEKYIERCLRSLFEQTLYDIEYIFVNDCTPDNSMIILEKVLKEYPNRIKQVKIINHEQNQGQAGARTSGMKAMTGEYMIHCDPDDWVELNMYELLYDTALKEKADIVWCDYFISNNNKEVLSDQSNISDNIELIKRYLCDFQFMASLCNRLINTRIIKNNDIIYPISSILEDLVLVTQFTFQSKKNIYLNKSLYHYRRHSSSITGNYSEKALSLNLKSALINFNILLSFFSKEALTQVLSNEILYRKFQFKNKLIPLVLQLKNSCSIWNNIYPEINYCLFLSNKISLKDKIRSLLLLLHIYKPINRLINGSKN